MLSCSSNVSYGAPTLELLPLPHEEQDLFASNAYPFIPYNTLPTTRQHQNRSLLATFTYVPTTNDTHYVTDCNPTAVANITALSARYPRISVPDALAATNTSKLLHQGYPKSNSIFTNYYGGGLFFMVDRMNNLFNTNGTCGLWLEQIVFVSTDTHWVAFTGRNFVPGFSDSATVRAVIDGVQLPAANARARDMELVEVLLPSFLGRRRLQIDVNGVRSNGIVLVNAKPLVQGFMEWRLGMEDVRGPSPRREDYPVFPVNFTGPTWGGYGAWNSTKNCTKVVVVGHFFGSDADVAAGRVNVSLGGTGRCAYLESVRHHRLSCCIPMTMTNPSIVVSVGGQSSIPVTFHPDKLMRKPIITVRSDLSDATRCLRFAVVICLCPFSGCLCRISRPVRRKRTDLTC